MLILPSLSQTIDPSLDDTAESFFSPGALHRQLRGELARYDTFNAGIEHVRELENTQQFTEAQHDTIAMARAMKVTFVSPPTVFSQIIYSVWFLFKIFQNCQIVYLHVQLLFLYSPNAVLTSRFCL